MFMAVMGSYIRSVGKGAARLSFTSKYKSRRARSGRVSVKLRSKEPIDGASIISSKSSSSGGMSSAIGKVVSSKQTSCRAGRVYGSCGLGGENSEGGS